ncbi:MAG: DUF2878 domain-containing protein [Pseudomonadota bacterium]
MNRNLCSYFINFVGYQSLWFTAILGGNSFLWAPLIWVTLHVGMSKHRLSEGLIIVLVTLLGTAWDGVLAAVGYFSYPKQPHLIALPLWHVALWTGFACTLRHSMRYMVERPMLMSVCAALLAPISYAAAYRFGSVDFPYGVAPTLVTVGFAWGAVCPIVASIVRFAASDGGLTATDLRSLITSLRLGT